MLLQINLKYESVQLNFNVVRMRQLEFVPRKEAHWKTFRTLTFIAINFACTVSITDK